MTTLHQLLALLTVSGLLLRGIWVLRAVPLAQHPLTRILPHIVDTVFLASGIALIVKLRLDVLQQDWLLAKFAGLIVYILLGVAALRLAKRRQLRIAALLGALLSFAYIAGVAVTRSPLPWQHGL